MFDLFGFRSKKKVKELNIQLTELKSKYDEVSANLDATSKSLKDSETSLKSIKRQFEECRLDLEDEQEDNKKKTELLNKDNEKFTFIANVVNAEPITHPSFKKFRELLHKDYMEFANSNDALASEAYAVLKLQRVEKQLELLSHDPALLNKNIIALAGLFSSGKSSFMNSLLKTGEIVLPISMEPTTAIASYVMNGEKKIEGFSENGGKIEIPNDIFSLFCHGKIEEFKFNMKKIINHIVLKDEFLIDLNNCCFIDTPGFESGNECQIDTDTAFEAIETANVVLWFATLKDGTLDPKSKRILSEIIIRNQKQKVYVVLNKADLLVSEGKGLEHAKTIMKNISFLIGKKVEGISLYSSNSKINEQPGTISSCYEKKSIVQFLNENNIKNEDKESIIIDDIEQVFDSYINADNEKIYNLEKQLVMIDIFNNSVQAINDSKDVQLSDLKSKLRLSNLSKELKKKYDTVTEEFSDENLLEISSSIREGLLKEINKYKDDIFNAHNICFKMKEAVAELFGHKISDEINPDNLVKEYVPDLFKELQKKYSLKKEIQDSEEYVSKQKKHEENDTSPSSVEKQKEVQKVHDLLIQVMGVQKMHDLLNKEHIHIIDFDYDYQWNDNAKFYPTETEQVFFHRNCQNGQKVSSGNLIGTYSALSVSDRKVCGRTINAKTNGVLYYLTADNQLVSNGEIVAVIGDFKSVKEAQEFVKNNS